MDYQEYLDLIWNRYEDWHKKGRITNTSKVIPIGESLAAKQWVIPTQRVEHYIKNSRCVALTHCRCRTLGKKCDSPTETCFLFNDVGEKAISDGRARKVTLEEARQYLALADKAGLVPMTLFDPEQHILALCHCCPCCCHDLQFMINQKRDDLVAQADYAAVQDSAQCSNCGICVERCHFGARSMVDGSLALDPEKCYGCGLCVTTCPEDAISMQRREQMQSA